MGLNIQYDRLVAEGRKPEEAARICDELEAIGGFGDGRGRGIGGLDLTGLLAESNTAISDKEKARIAELAGVNRKDLDKKIESGRKAVARGIQSKDDIIPPDQLGDGTFNDGSTLKDHLTR